MISFYWAFSRASGGLLPVLAEDCLKLLEEPGSSLVSFKSNSNFLGVIPSSKLKQTQMLSRSQSAAEHVNHWGRWAEDYRALEEIRWGPQLRNPSTPTTSRGCCAPLVLPEKQREGAAGYGSGNGKFTFLSNQCLLSFPPNQYKGSNEASSLLLWQRGRKKSKNTAGNFHLPRL